MTISIPHGQKRYISGGANKRNVVWRTGNSTQYPATAYGGKESDSASAHLKLTQHCKQLYSDNLFFFFSQKRHIDPQSQRRKVNASPAPETTCHCGGCLQMALQERASGRGVTSSPQGMGEKRHCHGGPEGTGRGRAIRDTLGPQSEGEQ